jgi:HlyD family secretion protein
VTYDVVIKVDNPDLRLKPGMTTNVSIIISTHNDVLRIPKAALRFSPAPPEKNRTARQQQKGPAVWILENNAPKRMPVTVGISDGNHTELVSGDLKEGQDVIVESLVKAPERVATPPRMF